MISNVSGLYTFCVRASLMAFPTTRDKWVTDTTRLSCRPSLVRIAADVLRHGALNQASQLYIPIECHGVALSSLHWITGILL